MKDKFLPWFLLVCALGLSGTAAFYSVYGLSIVFIGVATPVIVMGTFLEISKIAIATYLHDKWSQTYGVLKIYLTMALIILSVITSMGIYGLLSVGFQKNIAKLEINQKEIKNLELKKERFYQIKEEITKEKVIIDGDITKLREGLSNNTTTQSVDRRTGQMVTKANNANRLSFEGQIKDAQKRRDELTLKTDNYNDSITGIDVKILEMESKEISGSELGAIKYVSELMDWSVKKTANLFIMVLIFVFDPLAITLVIATNQAFRSLRKHEEDDNNTSINNPEIIEVVKEIPVEVIKEIEVPVEIIKEVEVIKEVPVYLDNTIIDNDEYFEMDDYHNYDGELKEEVVNEVEEDNVDMTQQTIVNNEPKRLSYYNRNGGSLRINRI